MFAQGGEMRRGALVQMPAEERGRALAGFSLFKGLSAQDLQPLAAAATVQRYQPGDFLVRQGEPGESVFVILTGRVEVIAGTTHQGVRTEAVVSWLGPGDAVGELALLDGQPRSAACVAVTPVVCLRLGRDTFRDALHRHRVLSDSLLEILAQRLRLADQLIAEQARDPLTGLNNRKTVAALYEREALRIKRAARQAALGGGDGSLRPLGVVFADIDRFKHINDRYGHHVGDDVLRAVARVLTGVSRATDLVARYGGDEFVMLLPEAGTEGTQVVVGRIRSTLADTPPGPVPFSMSLGTALVNLNDPESLEALLAQADSAMFQDKSRLAVTAN